MLDTDKRVWKDTIRHICLGTETDRACVSRSIVVKSGEINMISWDRRVTDG